MLRWWLNVAGEGAVSRQTTVRTALAPLQRYFRKVAAIVWKDVQAELRTRDIFSAMFVFAVLALLIFEFAFELRVDNVRAVAPGVLWVTITFAAVLGLSRSFALELDRRSIEALLLAPVDRSALYLGKLIGNLIFIFAVELLLLPLFLIFFELPLYNPGILLAVALGTLGLAAVGTLLSAMAANTRAREVLLPILMLPVAVPVVIAGVRITGGLLDGDSLSDLRNWLHLLIAFDVIFITVAFLTFDVVMEE